MNTLTWVYPQSIDELRECLLNNTPPHGGGTGFMRNPPRSGALADLSGVRMDAATVDGSFARFGGATTFNRAAEVLAVEHRDHVLVRALNDAASPALRNRITVGGSIALFPPWSSIVGPLVALEAKVELVGAHEGWVPVAEYLDNRQLGEHTAIVTVEVDVGSAWTSHWYRFARTHFNYPLFTVTVLTRGDGPRLSAARIVITGNRGRYRRLVDLEARVAGNAPPHVLTADDLGTDIPGRQGFTGEYLTHLATVEVARGLRQGPPDAGSAS